MASSIQEKNSDDLWYRTNTAIINPTIEEPMSSQPKRKQKEELYTYSWYLPVVGDESQDGTKNGGHEASAVEQQPEVSPPEPITSNALPKQRGPLMRFKLSTFSVRLVGLTSWTAVAGIGLMILVGSQSPVPIANVAALAGVWAGISALVWFIPGKLMK